MSRNQEIANTILSQLGGGRFRVMTGATDFIALGSDDGHLGGLVFRIGRFSGVKTTHVRVYLEPSDTYTVEFLNVRGITIKTVACVEDVYAENLKEVFTRHTGLRVSL